MSKVIRLTTKGDIICKQIMEMLAEYKYENEISDYEMFYNLQYVFMAYLLSQLKGEDISSDRKLVRRIKPIFKTLMEFLKKSREGLEGIF